MLGWFSNAFFEYYGIDWIAALFLICYWYYNGEKKRIGFVFGILASICWIVYAYLSNSLANIIINLIGMTFFIIYFFKWKEQ